MERPIKLTRRTLLTGRDGPAVGPTQEGSAESRSHSMAGAAHHISSAVVTVLPRRMPDVLEQLSTLDGVEVHLAQDSKIVVVIEGPTTGALGDCLTRIALLDGVITANMVFEHIEKQEVAGS